ncbi:MFS transporter [Sneathiella marina]|uniref:MFS transporter n=1 Tax=Sneathiella marina TaxID=2950108 RepID=A0ABY4W7F2_9PROT|nr:MFS transporter [Sneathiella marina]USG62829.1 MFS transporter [Sneathiella marina]
MSTAYFMVGTSSLSVIGLTYEIADGLRVSPADIAFLITVFALTFAIAAPLTQVFLYRLPRITILSMGLIILAGAQVMGAYATSYEMLFISRGIMGLGAASVSPMCSAIGAGLAPQEQQGRAMGIVFAGLTVASVLGTPLTAYLGTLIGWRNVLLLLAFCCLLSMTAVLLLVRDRNPGAESSLRHLMRALMGRRSSGAILMTFLQMTSIFCTYALIAPYMTDKFNMPENLIAVVLLVYGVNGVLGNVFAGRLGDRFGPDKIILISLLGLAAGLLILQFVAPVLLLAFIGVSCWAFFGMMFHSPQQQRIANIDPAQRSLLLALNASALYLGISIGSWISNVTYVAFGHDVLPLVSLGVLLICMVPFGLFVLFGSGKKKS